MELNLLSAYFFKRESLGFSQGSLVNWGFLAFVPPVREETIESGGPAKWGMSGRQ